MSHDRQRGSSAVVARSAAGDEARFDDPECAARFIADSPQRWQVWLHTAQGWLRADHVWLVRRTDRITPMGSGLLAFADRAGAERVGDGDPVVRWDDLWPTRTASAQ